VFPLFVWPTLNGEITCEKQITGSNNISKILNIISNYLKGLTNLF
jgi:hypothetical protein